MVQFDVDGVQNVEISKKLPCEKSPKEQLEIMQLYTKTHAQHEDKALREAACLSAIFPRLFRKIEATDMIVGRIDFLPIGFGCVTSLGGVGHYCVFGKLREFQKTLESVEEQKAVDLLYDYWLKHDVKTLYCQDVLTTDTIGRFIDTDYAMIATARLSGMMLDYPKLLKLGIGGLREEILLQLATNSENEFLIAALSCLDLFVDCCEHLAVMAELQKVGQSKERQIQLTRMAQGLRAITTNPPQNFHDAMQLFWLYALLAGVINYGRLDDLLGPYLVQDIEAGIITEDEAYQYIKALWTMIENRRTTVNGRIIVGGKGRLHPDEADVFTRIALRVAKDVRYVEPQFTLRVTDDTPADIWSLAMEALAAGATYPTIYNDEVNVPAVSYGMRVDEATAKRYVPFGCTEFVLWGQSTGTPNICLNVLKIMTALMNDGIDPINKKKVAQAVRLKPLSEYVTFELLYDDFKKILDFYMDLSIDAQMHSYQVMNEQVSFIFNSMLMDDCIMRKKALLDGGVRYLGGTNEIYGLFNTSDALEAIRELVYQQKRYTLSELANAALSNFEGHEQMRQELWLCDKYGNDLDTADELAVDLYEYIAKGVRQRGIDAGMQYFLIVISNNQLNTEWGRVTGASLDGRLSGMYMNPANNPQGGANKRGPTAMLNSLAKIDARYHAGSVQNIKFSPSFFAENTKLIETLFKTYFKKGGSHIMVTVVGRGVLEDAMKHPENYPDLIVRVSGFSAVFVDLEADIQQELLSRVLYD